MCIICFPAALARRYIQWKVEISFVISLFWGSERFSSFRKQKHYWILNLILKKPTTLNHYSCLFLFDYCFSNSLRRCYIVADWSHLKSPYFLYVAFSGKCFFAYLETLRNCHLQLLVGQTRLELPFVCSFWKIFWLKNLLLRGI